MLSELAWYWDVAIFVAYLVIGAIFGVIQEYVSYGKIEGEFDELSILFMFFWPFVLLLVLAIGIPWCLYQFVVMIAKFVPKMVSYAVQKRMAK